MSKHTFVKQLSEEIQQEGLLAKNDQVVVGVSGGPDSMGLLYSLVDLNLHFGYGLSIHIAHLNHQLRGRECEADAAFVQAAADNLQLPCSVEQRDVAGMAAQTSPGTPGVEEIARRERYAFL